MSPLEPLDYSAGLGFRRDIAKEIIAAPQNKGSSFVPSFIEFAPENWLNVGGNYGKKLREAAELYPIFCHGLSLSIGSPEALDFSFLADLKKFFKDFAVQIYSEHLSFAKCDDAHFYELLPMPFTWEAVLHVAERIRIVQDFLERPLAIENSSYYLTTALELDEASFISAVVKEADCLLLLDVNNVYVNSRNHSYEPKEFIQSLPLERVAYMHIAGHLQKTEDLIVDTHGEEVAEEVFDLLAWTLKETGKRPVLLERDYNMSDFKQICEELERINKIISHSEVCTKKLSVI